MQVIFDKLTKNMQLIYRKAIDADHSLNQLQHTGKGKFSHIFADETYVLSTYEPATTS